MKFINYFDKGNQTSVLVLVLDRKSIASDGDPSLPQKNWSWGFPILTQSTYVQNLTHDTPKAENQKTLVIYHGDQNRNLITLIKIIDAFHHKTLTGRNYLP